MELDSLSLIDLRNLAKNKGIPNYSKLKKSDLIEKILENYCKKLWFVIYFTHRSVQIVWKTCNFSIKVHF